MEKRSSSEGRSEWVKAEAIDVRELFYDEPSTVQLVLLRPVNLIIVGPVTGKTYYFNGAGTIAEVDKDDAPLLLEKRSAASCCGDEHRPYFKLGG